MTDDRSQAVKMGLPPVAQADTQLLILGSLPGDASLKAGRYYAHPTNQFWRLLGGVIGEELHGLEYPERITALGRRRIGLWDVVGSARRHGSLDQAIREAVPNPLSTLVGDIPGLRAIAFNGAAAAARGRALLARLSNRITLINLPSSSAAHAVPIATKAERWAALREFCER